MPVRNLNASNDGDNSSAHLRSAGDRFATLLAQNARIAQVLDTAKAALEAIGAPEYFTAPGYDFTDVTAELDAMAPRTDAAAQRKIQDYADEKDAEDARDAAATRADFLRDRRLTE
jgi:hypothetical protein